MIERDVGEKEVKEGRRTKGKVGMGYRKGQEGSKCDEKEDVCSEGGDG